MSTLNKRDIALAKRYIARGEAGLFESGMGEEEIQDFLHRYDVQAYLRTLYKDFQEKGARRERVTYYALTELEKLIPQAISVVARVMGGLDVESGETPPTPMQYDAAKDLLDRLGVKVSLKNESLQADNPLAALQNLNINVNQNVIENNISTEKVLTMVDMFLRSVQKSENVENIDSVSVQRLPDKSHTGEANERLSELKARSHDGKKKKKKPRKVIDGRFNERSDNGGKATRT